MARRSARRVKLAAPSAWRDPATAYIFQRKYNMLRRNTVRYGVRNGYLVRVSQGKVGHVTTMVDIPQRIVGRRVFREVEEFDDGANGEEAYFSDVGALEGVGFDRERLFDDSTMAPLESGEVLFEGEKSSIEPRAEAYLGNEPPEGAFEVAVSYAEPQPSDSVPVTYRLETTLLSSVRLAYRTNYNGFNQNAHYPLDDTYTPAGVDLWLRLNFMDKGGKGYVFYVSEQWMQGLTGVGSGYRPASFVYRENLAVAEGSGFGDGTTFYFQTVLRRTIEDYVYPASSVEDWRQDAGHSALLTVALSYEDGELSLLWHHIWKLEDELEPRLLTKVRPTNIDDYPLSNGVSENGIKPKLYLAADGSLEGLIVVATSATAFYGSGSTDVDGGGSVPEISLVKATWDSNGGFSRELLFSNTPLSTVTHDKSWNYGGAEITAIGSRQDIFNQSVGRWLPLEICRGVYDGGTVYLSTYLSVVSESGGDSYTFVNPGLQGNVYYLNVANRCLYSINDAETDAVIASWDDAQIGASPYFGGQVDDVVLMHYGTYDAILTQGFAIWCGDGLFCAVSAATDNNTSLASGTLVLLVLDVEEGAQLKPLPSSGTTESEEQAATSIYCYQKRTYDDDGNVDTPAGIVLGLPGAMYISADEGDNWTKVSNSGFFAPTLVFSPLWKPEPFDPKGSLGG